MSGLATGAVADVLGGRTSGDRKRWLWSGGGALLVLLLGYFVLGRDSAPRITYETQPAHVGRLVVKVSATGNLQPTNQVDVGSELSGTVERVLVDDNDRVRKGQLLAQLDLSKLLDQVARSQATLSQAQAQVLTAEATRTEAAANLARLREVARLSGGQVPSKTELASGEAAARRADAALASARAAVQQASAQLQSDRTTVTKASIHSPIDGVVLTRKVEPGQTVAASFQAPVLFAIAENLAQMELQVNVDEADVGQVSVGQSASFSVDAYPDRTFPARIVRVGLGAQTTNNVVTYLTTLNVDNRDLALRPGMTATAEIVTLVRERALLVPNAALRWSPPAAADAAARRSVLSALMPRPPRGTRGRGDGSTATGGAHQTVWVQGADGTPTAVSVTVGATDTQMTEITGGALRAGQRVIVDSTEAKS